LGEVKKRKHGTGTVDWVTDQRGYLWARGKLRYRGQRYTTDGIGVGHTTRDALSKRERQRIEREVDTLLEKLKDELEQNRLPDRARERRPLHKQLDLWLAAAKSRTLPHSHADYASVAEHYIKPHPIARLHLSELQPEDVDEWLATLDATGASSSRRLTAYNYLLACLRALKADGYSTKAIETILASTRSRRPRHRKKPTRAYDAAQTDLLLTYLEAHREDRAPWSVFFAICLYAGLRYSEGAGLPWIEVHDTEDSLTVRWQLDRETREPREPKSEAGVRTVPLIPQAVELLDWWRARERARGRDCSGMNLVFVNTSARGGKDATLGYAAGRRQLAKLCEDAGLEPNGRTHVLRATFGTAAGAGGMPTHLLQGVMGHADAKTTAIYTKFISDDARRATDQIGERLRGRKREAAQ
jgi:integrase